MAAPPVYLIRDACSDDLKGIKRLAAILNTVNLPDDPKVLRRILEKSQDSFSRKIKDPLEREYLFVMEDPGSGEIIGTSQVIAQHGTREAPHIFFDVIDDERYSGTLDRHFRHRVLRLGLNYDGPTEIGGLVLDPKYRGAPGRLGKQLSFVRFLFMGMHPSWFRQRVLAELLPPLLPDGRSILWESLGAKFTGLTYQEADLISKENKEFIKGLFPTDAIYLTLLPKKVQAVVGEVGPDTRGVKKMLEGIGFQYMDRVDPFDGGPHFEADVARVTPVRETRFYNVEFSDEQSVRESAGAGGEGLVGYQNKKGRFRCAQMPYRDGKKGTIVLPHWAEKVLDIDDSDEVALCPMVRQVRM
ncbi:MAG: arginine N-succinyltransferase [Myxococcota bacterium]